MNSYLYLGIDIDEHLTLKKCVSTLFRNDSHKLYILRKVRPMLNKKASIDIVKTMICSIIYYGNMFISSCSLQDLSDLQVLQNNALRCFNVTTNTMYMEKYTKWIYCTFYTDNSDQSWKWDHYTAPHTKD